MKNLELFLNDNRYILLEETTKFVEELGIIPEVGDRITIHGKDIAKLDPTRDNQHNVVTVKNRWFNFSSSKLALIIKYEPF